MRGLSVRRVTHQTPRHARGQVTRASLFCISQRGSEQGHLRLNAALEEVVPVVVEVRAGVGPLVGWSQICWLCQLGVELVAAFDEVGFDVDGELGEAAVALDLAEAGLGLEHACGGPA